MIKTLTAILSLIALASLAAPRKEQAAGTLRVNANPDTSHIFVNRVDRGAPPFEAEMPPGEYLLVVSHDGYRSEYRSVLINADQTQDIQVDLEPLKGLVLAKSSPIGAEVTINGVSYGITPLLISSLDFDRYRIRYELGGYRAKEIEVDINDRVPRHLHVDLTSSTATLRLTGTVPDAEVFIDDSPRGTLPATIAKISPGDIALEVRAPGYISFKQELRLAEGELREMHINLREQPATIKVVSIPDAARVYFDNEFRGQTPLDIGDIPPGTHRLRVEQAGFDPNARTITLERGENRTEEFRLAGNTGKLLVTTQPDGVNIIVDGKEHGTTVAAQGEGIQTSSPYSVDLLTEGTHTIRFMRQGYFDKTITIETERGKTITQHVELDRRFIPNYEVITASGTYRGVFVSRDTQAIRIEVRPGVISSFLNKDIRTHHPLPDAAE